MVAVAGCNGESPNHIFRRGGWSIWKAASDWEMMHSHIPIAESQALLPPNATLTKDGARIGYPGPVFRTLHGLVLKREELHSLTLFPNSKKDLVCPVIAGNESETLAIISRWPSRVSTFDLNQHDLQFVAALGA